MRVLSALLVMLAMTGGAVAQAESGKRVALVIGQSAYMSVVALPNPARDAAAVAEALEKTGFKVQRATDRSLAALKADIDAFVKNVQQAGPGATALFFYGGHGLQRDGVNYLLPIEAKIGKGEELPGQAIALSDILRRLDATGAATKIVILDACRDNPWTPTASELARGLAMVLTADNVAPAPKGESGLARIEARSGTFVAFSTSPGATASDGSGDNSPYAAALLKLIPEPGLPIEQVFKRVRMSVHDATSGGQTPWETSSLTTNFIFVAGAPAEESGIEAKIFSKNRPTRTTFVPLSADEAYQLVVAWDAPDIYRMFVDIYPNDPRALAVHRSLSLRQQEMSWAEAVRENTADGYAAFLRLYPDSPHTVEARRLQLAAPRRNLTTAALCLPGQNNPPAIPLGKQRRAEPKKAVKPPTRVAAKPQRVRQPVEEVEDAPPPRRRRPPPSREVVEQAPSGPSAEEVIGTGIAIGIGIGGMRGGGRPRQPMMQQPSHSSHPR
jgi:hypothetical protein